MLIRLGTLPISLILLAACQPTAAPTGSHEEAQAILIPIPSPAGPQSAEPGLTSDGKGTTYLSWVTVLENGGHGLLMSKLEGDAWSTPKQIARGDNWFVNWADFPALSVQPSGVMAAHYLAKSGSGTYAYDIWAVRSDDGGESWSTPVKAHHDGVEGEHGFVSWIPWKNQEFFLTWLDGRNTGQGHGHGGAMTLRAGFFDASANVVNGVELDNRTCDCCQTAATAIPNGILVAYRDRSEGEIRDISLVRYTAGSWSEPYSLHDDGWEIAGCPVNGPSLDSRDEHVIASWFTAAQSDPRVMTSFSSDGGVSFSTPVRLDSPSPLGRVDVAFISEHQGLVTWLETTDDGARVVGQVVSADGAAGPAVPLFSTSERRTSGFPRVVVAGSDVLLAWTHLDQNIPYIKTGRLPIADLLP